MTKTIAYFNWHTALENTNVGAIDEDFILLEKPVLIPVSSNPFKADVTTVVICLKGTTEGTINLKPFKAEAPCYVVILPDQILEQKYFSDDFSGLFIIMSKQFTDNLLPNAQKKLPLFLSVQDNPCHSLGQEALEGMISYFEMLKRVMNIKEIPGRIEVVRHLTLAFFYGLEFSIHPQTENKEKSKNELLVERFMDLVQKHYKRQRLVSFYADKLCLTPKYLSKVIRNTSGKSASDWIDDYIILEAKALLKSGNMTVQQVCNELNFNDQSFFGKYFKRHTGMSPREYKRK
ncbi:MAG: helix-turn-helix domain-containing protein [Tannerellaceae bacterium]|nr:helix-turn-helix domain-containing protein [Tannerellaceae bacterium]